MLFAQIVNKFPVFFKKNWKLLLPRLHYPANGLCSKPENPLSR